MSSENHRPHEAKNCYGLVNVSLTLIIISSCYLQCMYTVIYQLRGTGG